MLRAGFLNRQVTIQRRNPARNALNEPVGEWVDLAPPVWANIKYKSGQETIKSDAEMSIVRASIQIRYRADVDATMRVIHGSTVYAIKAVLPDESRHEFVYLVCETGASDG